MKKAMMFDKSFAKSVRRSEALKKKKIINKYYDQKLKEQLEEAIYG